MRLGERERRVLARSGRVPLSRDGWSVHPRAGVPVTIVRVRDVVKFCGRKAVALLWPESKSPMPVCDWHCGRMTDDQGNPFPSIKALRGTDWCEAVVGITPRRPVHLESARTGLPSEATKDSEDTAPSLFASLKPQAPIRDHNQYGACQGIPPPPPPPLSKASPL